MPLYKLNTEQVQTILELINNFPINGNKEACRKYVSETDKIEKALSEPIELNIDDNKKEKG